MKLWLISQTENTGYDTYDSAVVAALSEKAAMHTHPSEFSCGGWGPLNGHDTWRGQYSSSGAFYESGNGDWAPPQKVTAQLLGNAIKGTKAGIICASFNAG